MRLSRVVGLSPRISAAPFLPRMRQPVISSTLQMSWRSVSRMVSTEDEGVAAASGTSIHSVGPLATIMARSITLRSSRTLPGQW